MSTKPVVATADYKPPAHGGHIPEIKFNENEDQLTQARQHCEHYVKKFKDILEECNARLLSKKKTSETCHMEMVDYVEALDHCAMPMAFKALK